MARPLYSPGISRRCGCAIEQVRHYIPYAKEDKDLQRILAGLIARQMFYINIDPYTNAFNETANDKHYRATDDCNMNPWMSPDLITWLQPGIQYPRLPHGITPANPYPF